MRCGPSSVTIIIVWGQTPASFIAAADRPGRPSRFFDINGMKVDPLFVIRLENGVGGRDISD